MFNIVWYALRIIIVLQFIKCLSGPDGYPMPGQFSVPHSMTYVEDRGWLCVADRENGRIQCFDLNGDFQKQYHPKEFGSRLFAVEYCNLHGKFCLSDKY